MSLFTRIGRLFAGFFSLFVSSAEDANPLALLENEKNNHNKAVADYNLNLGKQAGQIERLRIQIARDERQLTSDKAQATACVNAKQLDRAGQFALSVKKLTTSIGENQHQLNDAETLLKNLTRQRDAAVKASNDRIMLIKSKISQAQMAEAQSTLAQMASVQLFDPAGGGLGKLEERLDERIADARGKARVATDSIASSNWIATEAEQKALEAAALAEMLGTDTSARLIPSAQLAAPTVQDAVFVDDLAALRENTPVSK